MKAKPATSVISLLSFLLLPIFGILPGVAFGFSFRAPHDGDRLHPGLAATQGAISRVDSVGKVVEFVPNAFKGYSSADASVYVDGDTISYVQFATKHRFILRSDSLSYLGFENRATDFKLDSPVLTARLPFVERIEWRDSLSGHVFRHGNMLLRYISGSSSSFTDCGWILTDGTDTIKNATRLSWTLDVAYADSDSITPDIPDSIASERISDLQVNSCDILSRRILMQRDIWFADEARYPVMIRSRVSQLQMHEEAAVCDTVPVSDIAMFYPAPFQYADTGEEPDVKDVKKLSSDGDSGKSYGDYDGNDSKEKSLSVGEPQVNGRTVSVELACVSGATEVTLTLYSDSGMRLTEPTTVIQGTVPSVHILPLPDGWTGVLLLRVDTGDNSYTRKIIL